MLGIDLRKIYRFVPVEPQPAADRLPAGAMYSYECLDCQGIVNSAPHVAAKCVCGNLAGNAGKIVVRDPARVRVMTGRLK